MIKHSALIWLPHERRGADFVPGPSADGVFGNDEALASRVCQLMKIKNKKSTSTLRFFGNDEALASRVCQTNTKKKKLHINVIDDDKHL